MVANEIELKRGIVISFISAFLQGLVAVLVVATAYFVLRGSGITMTQATNTMEITSFVMVILFGGWLLYRKLRSMIREAPRRESVQFATSAGPVSLSLFDGAPDIRRSNQMFRASAAAHSGTQYVCDAPEHGTSADEICATCGRMHLPDPSLLKGENFSVREAWSAIVTVGLRPCSGALLVMTFSMLNSLMLGGILSVIAMSVGTALTVSLLAIFAVATKGTAMRLAGPGSMLATWVGNAIEILGALLVIATGVLLLGASLQT
jgi:nickel/cobalt exporter